MEKLLHGPAPEIDLPGTTNAILLRILRAQAKNGPMLTASVLRGETRGPLIFDVDGILILLDIQPTSEGTFSILGQVAAEDQDTWTDSVAELRQNKELQFSSLVDDLGAFRFEGLKAGDQELWVTPKDRSPVLMVNFEIST